MGIGDWGLGIGPNPQSPIPNPQSPIPIKGIINLIIKIKINLKINFYILNKIFKQKKLYKNKNDRNSRL